MVELAAGQRLDLQDTGYAFSVTSPRHDLLQQAAAVLLIGLDANARIPSDFAPVNSVTRELRPGLSFAEGGLSVTPTQLPADINRLIVTLYLLPGPGGGLAFREFGRLEARLGEHLFVLDLRDRGDSAIVVFELYRRGTSWRVMANGQGYAGGVGALSRALGIALSAPHAEPPSHDHSRPPRAPGAASGSGFAVDSRLILTNHHVVEDAQTIEVAGERGRLPAQVVAADPRNDMALLHVDRDVDGVATFRDDLAIHLGEDLIVLGFPLQGLLGSGPQVSSGNVSALCGIGNDSSRLQFTAPIASGNSGGPILDSAGLVIGLVCSSLNQEHVRQGGGAAENINFGVKAALVRSFLSAADVTPKLASAAPPRPRAEIARASRGFLVRIRTEI